MEDILDHFPSVQFACAYGSGVFKQPGLYSDNTKPADRPMVDLIFAVDDPLRWHRENIARHAAHYSFLKRLGPSAIDAVAEQVGAGVYFNTLVPWGPGMIKYGVVRQESLRRDLVAWDRLYLAGRLHKPVHLLSHHPGIDAALSLNLESALRVALLLLPERFSVRQLLRVVCGLSYDGDMRVGLAEDSSKVERIVQGSYERLVQLYSPPLTAAETEWKVLSREGSFYCAQDTSPAAKAPLIAALPAALLSAAAGVVGRPVPVASLSDPSVRAALASDLSTYSRCSETLRRCVASTVRASSWRQSAAGLLSAGALKSATYAWRKLKKAGGGGALKKTLAGSSS